MIETIIRFVLEGAGVSLFAIIVFWIFKYPVQRDRLIFGKHPSWMIWISSALIAGFVAILCLWGEFIDQEKEQLIVNLKPNHKITDSWWAIISQFTDPGNLTMAEKGGRLISLVSAMLGIVCLSGLLVSSIVNFLSRKSQKWQQGLVHYNKCFDKYVVIIGVNDLTSTIAKRCLKRKDVKYVLIQTRQDVEKMRMRLDLDLDKEEEDKLVFYFAERTSYQDVETLHLERAIEVYILGEDANFDNEQDHDAFNIKCLENISSYLKLHKCGRKRCHVNFEYQSTFTAFKSTHIYKSLDKTVEFIPFNVHEIWAKKVFVDNFAVVPTGKKGEVKVQNYFPLDSTNGIGGDDDHTVHLVIMGMNQMGTALATQAALIAHYPNYHRDRSKRTKITFIDDKAKVEGEFFRGRYAALFDLCRYRIVNSDEEIETAEWIDPMKDGRYKHLKVDNGDGNFTDIEWEFIQANVASDAVRDYLVKVSENETTHTTIAICFNHSQQSIATALYLPEMVYRRVMQVLVYQQNLFDLITKVETGEKIWKRYDKLRPFGMIERSYTENPFDHSPAKLLFYLYANKKMGVYRDGMDEYRYSDAPELSSFEGVNIDARFAKEVNDLWTQQGIVNKLSNIDMIDTIPSKLRSIGLSADSLDDFGLKMKEGRNWELLAKAEHTRWVTERLLMGFRPLDNKDNEWKLFPIIEDITDKQRKERRALKRQIEKKRRAHLDICSNTMLRVIDPDCRYNDMNVISYIPQTLLSR